jgi:hypothetical protein
MRQRPISSVDYLPRTRFNEAEAFSFDSADREIVVILDNNRVVGIGDDFSVEGDLDHGFCCYLDVGVLQTPHTADADYPKTGGISRSVDRIACRHASNVSTSNV